MFAIAEKWSKLRSFFSETRTELKKVTFPSRDEVLATTLVVLVTSFLFAFYLWIADIVILKLYEGIFRVLG